eukprot:g8128.t1
MSEHSSGTEFSVFLLNMVLQVCYKCNIPMTYEPGNGVDRCRMCNGWLPPVVDEEEEKQTKFTENLAHLFVETTSEENKP